MLQLVMFVVSVMMVVVLGHFENSMLGYVLCCLSVYHFFVPHFDVSPWHLKCTKHMDPNGSVVQ
jgi:hypothetical protein